MKQKLLLAALLAISFNLAQAESVPSQPPGIDQHGGPGMEHKGNVTREEFNRRGSEHFERMDVNQDGVLSEDERKAGRENMREKRKERRGERNERQRDDK